MGSLVELSERYNTDKNTSHSYLPLYDILFYDLRHKPITLLELGVAAGESIKLWLDYFTIASIIGIDVVPTDLAHSRFKFILGDQTDNDLIDSALDDESVDIIIDDGSHLPEHQALSHRFLVPKLKSGGLYIVEDVRATISKRFWDSMPGTVFLPFCKDDRFDDILVVQRKM